MNCADVQEVRDLYALGGLTAEDIEAVELHLLECQSCRADVQSAWRLAQLIRLAPLQVAPSASLRDRLMREASGADERAAIGAPVASEPVSIARRPSAAPRIRLLPFPVQGWTPAWASALAAAVPLVAAAWFGLQASSLQQRLDRSEEALRQTAQEARSVAELLGRGIQAGAEMARVTGTEMAPAASGMFYYGQSSSEGVLVVNGLPHLPSDQVYQLWLVSGSSRMNGGTFVLEDGGKGLLLVKAPMPLESIDSIAVTMEPMGGSPAPRGAGYMWGAVKST